MTPRRPEHTSTTSGRDRDPLVDLFNCRTCRRFTATLIEGRGWCVRDGAPKLIEVGHNMKHCWQPRRS